MGSDANLGPGPGSYYRSVTDWISGPNRTRPSGTGEFVCPFDFGGPVDFRAPRSIESWIHPYLTAYRLKPFDGYIASIPGGRVWGKSGAVLSSEGMLIHDLSLEYDHENYRMLEAEEHPLFRHWNHPKLEHLEGTVAVLTFCGSYNYFHWMYDVLPRLGMLWASGVPYSSLIMNPNPYGPFVEQTWAMLGLSEASVVRAGPETYIQAERLLVPSLIMSSHYPKWATDTLRAFLLPHRDQSFSSPERIYISRRQASIRRVVNEDEVIGCLEAYGFVPLQLEEWTVAQQIQIFAEAKVIVAPHGAGLANLAFCRPATKIVELFHPEHIVPTYWMISNHNNLDYYMMYGKGRPDPAIRFPGLEDIFVDIGRLKQTLQLAELTD